MKRFVEGEDRTQSTLFPERLDDYIGEDNPVRVVEAFVEELDLGTVGFDGIEPEATAGHPKTGWRSAVIYSVIGTCRLLGINPERCGPSWPR